MNRPPIALFAYNRADHLHRTISALSRNENAEDSDLFIYCDGPKKAEQKGQIEDTRRQAHLAAGFKSVTIIEREQNFGLAKSILTGVSQTLEKADSVIVLEDDIITSPYFLKFMGDSLVEYRSNSKVMHVSGYLDPIGLSSNEGFFHNYSSCWGWGTWKRAWEGFNPSLDVLIKPPRSLLDLFVLDILGSGMVLPQLILNLEGRLCTWAIRWNLHISNNGGLCFHPGKSLTRNIGFDGSGENCIATDNGHQGIADLASDEYLFPKSIQLSPYHTKAFCKYHLNGKPLRKRLSFAKLYLAFSMFKRNPNSIKDALK